MQRTAQRSANSLNAAAVPAGLAWPLVALLVGASLLSGCAAPPLYRSPAARTPLPTALPAAPPDIAAIPDAVPKLEPRSQLGNPPFYEVDGRRYVVLASAAGYVERGIASWYGPQFHGLRTAIGEPYDMFAMTAAHKTLPLPCYARVTNLANGRSIVVRINDRGPFVGNRIIDLSYTAAAKLDMIRTGTAFVQVETLSPAPAPAVPLPVATPALAAARLGPSRVPALTTSDLASLPSAAALFIQVGAFSAADNAQRTAERLRGAGLPHVFTLAADAQHRLMRVRIGPIATVQQYDALIARLASLGFPAARLAQD
jgi:rare lipoprotein A